MTIRSFLKTLFCKHDWVKVGESNICANFKCDKCDTDRWGNPPRKYRTIPGAPTHPLGNPRLIHDQGSFRFRI